ncbi:MAG TPA: Xaa-Pro peptidase family protein, partial [Vicinamibacteria bacterium]|nr:Xaa-Pro peptidase family protein [Vicinamibacteria bacterium]
GVTRSNDVFVVVSDRWDEAHARSGSNEAFEVILAPDPGDALARLRFERAAVCGLELMETRFVEALGSKRVPDSATADLERLRMVKTHDELDALWRAAALADQGYARFVEAARAGIPEYALVAEVEAFLKSRGAEDNFMLLSSGGTEVRSMKPATEKRLAPGDLVATELTPQVNGFYAQICRTLVVGAPSQAQQEAFEIFRRAQQAAEDLLKPGVLVSDVARAENDVFREAGFGAYTGPEYTRVRGHGLGRFVDEKPQILEDVDSVVEEGMVLIAHPNTYLPTVGYMVFGDALVVTKEGCESLSTTEKKLFHTAP